jgi:hypothetical protein
MAQTAMGKRGATSKAAVRTEVRKHLKTSALDLLQKNTEAAQATGEPNAEGAIPTIHEVVERLGQGSGKSATPPPTLPSPLYPAMTAKEFVNGDYVEPGDIVLMTRLGSFFSWLLRMFDKSDFAHAAMVFQTPRHLDGIDHTFLIETSMGGVEIVSLSQFLFPTEVYADTGLPADFVIGIKRLESPWSNPIHRRMAASRMPRTRNLYFRVRESLRGRAPNIGDFLKKGGGYLPKQFICSGFVQYAFVDMVRTAYHRGLIDKETATQALEDVIFCPNSRMTSAIEELMACTPNHIANTEKLQWKYLIHKGDVFHVASKDDVQRFFKETLPKRVQEPIPA